MKKIIALGLLIFIIAFGSLSVQMDVFTPPIIAQEVAFAAPWAAEKITRWVFRTIPEKYSDDEYGGDLGVWNDAWDQASSEGNANVGVYNGGLVEFLNAHINNPNLVCAMASTQITDCYAVPRPGYSDHGGIDFGIDPNEPIFTPMSGVITYAGWSEVGYGFLVVIENGGYQIYLGHNNELLVQVGQEVVAGEIVALSGSTGNSTGTHIHFEVRSCDEVTGFCSVIDPNEVMLPGQNGFCDWYFGQQTTVQYYSGFTYSCGVDGLDIIVPPTAGDND